MSECVELKKAILIGSLENGFVLERVVSGDASAKQAVKTHLDNGNHAEVITVYPPSSIGLPEFDSSDGEVFVITCTEMFGHCTLYGAFSNADRAREFAETQKSFTEKWQVLSFYRQA